MSEDASDNSPKKLSLGRALDGFGDFMESNWRVVRFANIAVVAGATAYIVHSFMRRRQVRFVEDLGKMAFEDRKEIRVKVQRLRRENSLVYVDVVHVPKWVPNLWVSEKHNLPVRLFGLRSQGMDGRLLLDAPGRASWMYLLTGGDAHVQLLFREGKTAHSNKHDSENDDESKIIVGHLLFSDPSISIVKRVLTRSRQTNFGKHLVETGQVEPFLEEAPGEWCSENIESIRSMNIFLETLAKAQPIQKQDKEVELESSSPSSGSIKSRIQSMLPNLRLFQRKQSS